jgi:putative FmdB family regulatory protein
MPIYEYECKKCGYRLEQLQKFGDKPLIECPKCHKSTLQKLISTAGFQLKGSGWYTTDFKGKGEQKEKQIKETSKTEQAESKSEGKNCPISGEKCNACNSY